ncbi:helix-turn-helix domain-containing protein [Leucobacter komagatae]|uniref:helix-turn-helix domain-containing protein n=1 Tax=Leucobacter komagatae TaxID=55969 RepID=UPI00114EFD75|nr:helix-turn-helix domain-containing protein [Leucobacter komagatae]
MVWNEERARQLGETVRRLRRERRLSQETLAFQSGITKNQVQLIEAGKASGRADTTSPSNPRLSTLTGLANTLGMDTSELLAQAGM